MHVPIHLITAALQIRNLTLSMCPGCIRVSQMHEGIICSGPCSSLSNLADWFERGRTAWFSPPCNPRPTGSKSDPWSLILDPLPFKPLVSAYPCVSLPSIYSSLYMFFGLGPEIRLLKCPLRAQNYYVYSWESSSRSFAILYYFAFGQMWTCVYIVNRDTRYCYGQVERSFSINLDTRIIWDWASGIGSDWVVGLDTRRSCDMESWAGWSIDRPQWPSKTKWNMLFFLTKPTPLSLVRSQSWGEAWLGEKLEANFPNLPFARYSPLGQY